jgi:hypothetical protein
MMRRIALLRALLGKVELPVGKNRALKSLKRYGQCK